MIMQAALALAICSLVVEGVLVWFIPPVHRFYMNSNFGMVVNVLASVGLSIGLGAAFGATGLIVMMGGIISTAASALGFHRLTFLLKENKDEITAGWHQITGKIASAGQDLLGFVKFLLAIPIRIGRAYNNTVRRIAGAKTFVSSLKEGLRS